MNSRNLHQVCDLVIESSIPLPELATASTTTADCHFDLLPAGEEFAGEYRWFNRWVFQGETRLGFAFRGEDYLLRFPNLADFLVSRSGLQIRCRPSPDVSESTMRHLLLDSVIPLILSRRESLVLHASAILMDNGAIAFIGTSGRGKSTLAASNGQLGYPIISDDYLVVRRVAGRWLAVPSYPGVRLLPCSKYGIFGSSLPSTEVAAYTCKRRVSNLQSIPFSRSVSKMHCLYMLDEEGMPSPQEPTIESISPKETFMKLVSSSFNLDITDKKLLRRQFATLRRMLLTLPCFRLRYAREFRMLPVVSQMIAAHQERIKNARCAHGSRQDRG